MPVVYESIHYRTCTSAEYKNLSQIDENSIYFIYDTNQIYVGSSEYTKSAGILETRPSSDEIGEEGKMYICSQDGSSYAYIGGRWITIFDPTSDFVKTISPGEGIECDPNPIINQGTISHSIPSGAEEIVPDTSEVQLQLGQSFNIHEVKTDKFGHVTGLSDKKYTMPTADELSTVFKFKGTLQTVDELPTENNVSGDVYYIVQESCEYVYLETGWEELGPILDLSNLVPKNPQDSGYVAAISEDGSVISAGFKPVSGVTADTYGSNSEDTFMIPQITVDTFGRITSAQDLQVRKVSPEYAADVVSWAFEQYLA